MEIYRKEIKDIKPGKLEIGDEIKIRIIGEEHTATAIKKDGDGTMLLLNECLDKMRPMNEDGGTKGGYDASDMRKFLQEAGKTLEFVYREELPFLDNIQDMLMPFENGDLLTLLSCEEVCGEVPDTWEMSDRQIPWMKDRRNRIAVMKGEEYVHWWLRDPVSAANFAIVNYTGIAGNNGASNALGVRPAFAIVA